jgi:hypothetical protein
VFTKSAKTARPLPPDRNLPPAAAQKAGNRQHQLFHPAGIRQKRAPNRLATMSRTGKQPKSTGPARGNMGSGIVRESPQKHKKRAKLAH